MENTYTSMELIPLVYQVTQQYMPARTFSLPISVVLEQMILQSYSRMPMETIYWKDLYISLFLLSILLMLITLNSRYQLLVIRQHTLDVNLLTWMAIRTATYQLHLQVQVNIYILIALGIHNLILPFKVLINICGYSNQLVLLEYIGLKTSQVNTWQ
jgi:hypothetical protein